MSEHEHHHDHGEDCNCGCHEHDHEHHHDHGDDCDHHRIRKRFFHFAHQAFIGFLIVSETH